MTQPEHKTVTIDARHTFTDAEMSALGVHASRSHREYERTEEEFKSAKKDWQAKLDRIALDRDGVLRKLGDGFEMRPVNAVVRFHFPEKGRKTFYRSFRVDQQWTHNDGGESESFEVDVFEGPIREEAMDATDFQRDLPLGNDPAWTGEDDENHPFTLPVLCAELDRIVITSENIGTIRAKYLIDGDDAWNAHVRDETAKREKKSEPVNPERFPETGDSAAEVREAKRIVLEAGENIGTPMGAALDQAAAATTPPPFKLDIVSNGPDGKEWTVVSLMKAVRMATKSAGWTEAQRSTLNDALKKASGVNAMLGILRPFVIAEEPQATEGDDPGHFTAFVTTPDGTCHEVPLLEFDCSDFANFPLEKLTGMFRFNAVHQQWPADAINAVVNEAERQARVIGDEPEATQQATKYLRSFCVSKETFH